MKYISKYDLFPEASYSNGYWIHGDEIYDLTTSIHQDFILDNPEKFGYTTQELKDLYDKYGENFHQEGKAREELIKNVSSLGWVRVRHYSKPQDYWSIQCDNIDRRRHTIENFIYWAVENKIMGYNDPAVILGYDNPEDKKVYNWDSGGIEQFLSEEHSYLTVNERRAVALRTIENIPYDFIINESSLSRVIQHGKNGFMILSAFKGDVPLEENLTNSRALQKALREKNLGFFQLIGVWDINEEVEISKPPTKRIKSIINKAKQTHINSGGSEEAEVELSYFVPYNEKSGLSYEEFKKLGLDLIQSDRFNQYAYIYSEPSTDSIILKTREGYIEKIWKGITLNSISKCYSMMKNNLKRHFLFEGVRYFHGIAEYMYAQAIGAIITENSYFLSESIKEKNALEGE